MKRRGRKLATGALPLGFVLLGAQTVLAQTSQPPSARWDVSFLIGAVAPDAPTSGASALPGPGPTRSIGAPLNTSTRTVSSWFFGDGALLARESVAPGLTAGLQLVSLDDVLTSASASPARGTAFAVRARRPITPRVSVEFGLDVSGASPTFTSRAREAIEASRAAFETGWGRVFAGTPVIANGGASAIAEFSTESGRQILTTGAAEVTLLSSVGGGSLYALAGGGVLSNLGTAPSVTLTGNYHGDLGGSIPYNETDRVTIRVVTARRSFVTVVGAGWRRAFSPRWGLRADVRANFSANTTRLEVSASPERVLINDPSRQAVLVAGGSRSIWFHNGPGLESSLSGPDIVEFVTFDGSGLQRHLIVGAGIFMRF